MASLLAYTRWVESYPHQLISLVTFWLTPLSPKSDVIHGQAPKQGPIYLACWCYSKTPNPFCFTQRVDASINLKFDVRRQILTCDIKL